MVPIENSVPTYSCIGTIIFNSLPNPKGEKSKLNIRDVAKRARVSTATVSRVMSGIDVVKPSTRERVQAAIAALNYVPNFNARSLSLGRSRLLGIIISDITNPFFPDLIKTFNDLAEKHGYGAIVAHTNYDAQRMQTSVQRMLEQKVEGLAVMTSEMSEPLIRQLEERKVPTVFLDMALDSESMGHIRVDYEAGIHQALDHITSLGHKNIAFISGPQDLRSAAWRQTFFLKALQEKGITIEPHHIVPGNHRVDGGYEAMKKLLASRHRPTAVLASNDLTAFGAIHAIYEAGLEVPRDISVVGFDDIEVCSAYNPPLTTVRISRVNIGTQAFEALYGVSQGKSIRADEKVVVPELIVRKSTAPPQK